MALFPMPDADGALREVVGERDPDALAEWLIAALQRLFPGRDVVVTDVQLEHSRTIADLQPDSSARFTANASLPARESSAGSGQPGRVQWEYQQSPPLAGSLAAGYRLLLDLHTIPPPALNELMPGAVTPDSASVRQIQVVAKLQHALTISGQAVIGLTPDDHIEFLSGAALQLIRRYFGSPADTTQLPEPLCHWVGHQRDTCLKSAESAPLLVQNGAGRLAVHHLSLDGQARYLLLHEDQSALTPEGFTPREHEVLSLWAAGLIPEAIASKLAISTATVRNHLSRICRKLGARNQADAAQRARAILEEPSGQSVR